MNEQYCKVGNTTPIEKGVALLEYQYQLFVERANNIKYRDTNLVDFFEQKAQKIKKALEELG